MCVSSFQSLVTFVNKHLNKVNLEVTDLDSQFHDGVYLTLLMGLLEGFFVPLFSFHLTPQDFEQKVHNVQFAFELMQDVGLAKPKARPEGMFKNYIFRKLSKRNHVIKILSSSTVFDYYINLTQSNSLTMNPIYYSLDLDFLNENFS